MLLVARFMRCKAVFRSANRDTLQKCTYSVNSILPWPTALLFGRTGKAHSSAFALVISKSISSIFLGTHAELGVLYSSIRVTLQVAFVRTCLHSKELAFHWNYGLEVALKSVAVAAFVSYIDNCSLVLCRERIIITLLINILYCCLHLFDLFQISSY